MTSIMDHGVLGDRCCQKEDYLGAIEHYSAALKTCSSRLIPELLNKRTAVFIKLQKYQRALPDAKDILKRRPDLAMILQLMGMPDKALNILELGLSKVKVGGDPARKKLSEHYEALRNKRKSSTRVDPLTKLPREIVEKIFDALDIKFCVRCLAVSKGWRNFLETYPALWQDLKVNRDITITALKAWLKRSEKANYGLRSAKMKFPHFSAKYLNQLKLMQRCPKLASLELDIGPVHDTIHHIFPPGSHLKLRTLILFEPSYLSLSNVQKLLERLPALQHVEFHDVVNTRINQELLRWPEMPNLQFILLHGASAPGLGSLSRQLNLGGLIRASPNVNSAIIGERGSGSYRAPDSVWEFNDFTQWKNLTYLDIHAFSFNKIPKFPTTLKHLDVSHIEYFTAREFHALPEDYFYFPDLEYLSVRSSRFVFALNELANPGLISGSLKTLDIGDCSRFGGNRFDSLAEGWPDTMPAPSAQLEVLSLRQNFDLPERKILALLAQYPNLKRVDLGHTLITGTTVRELFQRENRPSFINLEFCDDCHYDAVEAARNIGIEVNHRMWAN